MAKAAMAPEFTMDVKDSGAALNISMQGVITEVTDLQPPDVTQKTVVIDVSGITRINSMGVRGWILFMEEMAKRTPRVVLRRLSPIMVTQASMITTFLGTAEVESFMAPWVCPQCDHAVETLHGFHDDLPPGVTCEKCQTLMELDWDRDAYLAFREPV